jgi:uncharacterized protein YtpQ (UPF0354 family)
VKSRYLGPLLMALVFLSLTPFARAEDQAIPTDVNGFTAYMGRRFSDSDHASKTVVKGPLTLEVRPTAGGDPHTVSLDNVWSLCERNRPGCRAEVENFVTGALAVSRSAETTADPADLRVVARNAAYVRSLQQTMAGSPGSDAVVRPVAGDVWMMCVLDQPRGIKFVNESDLAKLGLTEDQAFARALKNVAGALKPLAGDAQPIGETGFVDVSGDFYEASRLLLHDSWADLSRDYDGHLIIAVPSTDVLIYGKDSGAMDRKVLGLLAVKVAQTAPRPISITLLHWTPAGWDTVTP